MKKIVCATLTVSFMFIVSACGSVNGSELSSASSSLTQSVANTAVKTAKRTMAEFPISNTSWPVGIASGPDGNLWFTGVVGNSIGKITLVGQSQGSLSLPVAILLNLSLQSQMAISGSQRVTETISGA